MGLRDASFTLNTRFMASCKSYGQAGVVLVGVPMDFTCSFRPGARFGPQKIREISVGIEEYSVYMDKSLDDTDFYDCGDLDLPMGDIDKSLEMIGASAEENNKRRQVSCFYRRRASHQRPRHKGGI